MKLVFLSYTDDSGKQHHQRFSTHCLMWEWIQEFMNTNGSMPRCMLVFEATCIFDGSF